MDINRTRLFLYVALAFLCFNLYTLWIKEHPAPAVVAQNTTPSTQTANSVNLDELPAPVEANSAALTPVDHKEVDAAQLISVETDVLRLKISPKGGDIVYAELKNYPQTLNDASHGFVLLDKSDARHYYLQSGLLAEDGPDSYRSGRGWYTSKQTQYVLQTDQKMLEVPLTWQDDQGILIIKRFRLYPGEYRVEVEHTVTNHRDLPWQGNAYGQIARKPLEHEKSKAGFLMMQTYQGGAISTPEKPFKKLPYDKFNKTQKTTVSGGWAAMVEHYFLSAWIPDKQDTQQYFSRLNQQGEYVLGSVGPQINVASQQSVTTHGQVYLGPEIAETLSAIAPGLELTVDYGFLWPVSSFLFWLLKHIHIYVGNWGWAIIALTCVIKLAFYKLSATSYRSMGNMRRLQPKIEQLKQTYGEDRGAFSQKMMELYRKEKVNPLGGCLPILVQIPVFIAFYYMLLESVELRLAPFMFWIQDLSSKDPFYVLPIIMGVTMLLQQKMNPTPPDPIQAKMMMAMPFIFTVLFLQFPSGLVLYWVANNLLSITQQWFILRKLEK
jgi:YidC/Oxa1 family membrane protein insertase